MLNIGQFEISRVIESEGPFLPVRDFIPDAEQAVIEAAWSCHGFVPDT